MMGGNTAVSDFLHTLSQKTVGDVRVDDYSRVLYSTDASIYQVKPHGVLIPKTVDDVQAAVELAAKYQVPVLARTAGSSLAGQAVNEALIIDFTRHLDQILEINPEEKWVRVQPGIVLDALNEQLRPYGLKYGPDPASSNRAAMGGIVSNNSTGAHSILYGMTADHVLEMNVILNDGSTAYFALLTEAEVALKLKGNGRDAQITRAIHQLTQNPAHQAIIREGTPRHWRRCGGYNLDRFVPDGVTFQWPRDPRFNLAKLVCGAEGTLAIITDIKLNLVPRPTRSALAVVHFDSLFEALTAVPIILETGPTAVEVLDHYGLTLCREVPEYARLLDGFIEGDPNCVLITEFYGESEAELKDKVAKLQTHLKGQMVPVTAVVPAYTPQLQADVWKVRKVGLGLLMSIKGDYKPIPFIEDAAVPVEHLAEYVTKVEQFCHDIGTNVAYYAHASAGCLHIRPLINTKKAEEVAKLPQITRFSVDLLKGYGGAFSSEHGDGRARSWLNEAFFGPDLYNLFRQVKNIFDPAHIFNPNNIVDAAPMTENLRYGAQYHTLPIQPFLDFSSDQGFDRAVEMCNGAGICRKRTTDVMCPSFMATREEEHATRGRANALRAALSGHLPAEAFTSKRMYQVMDLCVSCKACKAECPSSVDMAKIKTEFLAQYQAVHGVPLRNRFFAHIDTISRLGAGWLAPLTNLALRAEPVRWGMEKVLGISRKRPLPPLTRTPFTKWFASRPSPPAGTQGKVVLFTDTFNTYNYPEVAIAATEVLEAAGFEVLLPGVTDCGRPAISKGLVAHARHTANRVLAALESFAAQGLPIVFLEPSELSAVLDDYHALLPGDGRLAQVTAVSLSFEQFIAKLADEGQLMLTFTDQPRHLLLHGHCHQRALLGTKSAHRALTLPPRYTLTELDTSCCGMAGSFGFEVEHVAVSQAMAERRLLPAVREAAPETRIVAAGVSCRQQIMIGSGKRPYHPAQIIREAIIT